MIVWGVLVVPDRPYQLTPADFVRIPVEGLALVAVALVLSAWPRRIVAAVAGILFGLLTLLNILNMAFYAEVGRAFNPVLDWGDLAPAIGVVRDEIGATRTNIVLAVLWLGVILVIGAITASAIHLTAVAARHRRVTVRALAALTAVWGLCAGLSLQLVPGSPVASTSAAGLAFGQVRGIQASLRDQRRFEQAIHGSDPEASVPASDLLTGLRGKDVIIAFVESYGQVAVQGTSFSAGRRRRPAPGHRLAGQRRLVHAERLDHLPGLRRDQLVRPLHPAVGAVGQQPNSGMANLPAAAGSPSAMPSTRRAGAPSTTPPLTTLTGRPVRPSTTSTRSTTGATSATAARSSATPRCPTSTPWPSSSGSNSPQATSP